MFNKILMVLSLVMVAQVASAGKVVVFDPEAAITNTKLSKKKFKALQAKPEFAQLIAQAESFKADSNVLLKEEQAKAMTWSIEERTEHKKKIEYIFADYKLVQQKIQAEHGAVAKSILDEMQPKLEQALNKIIESGDIDIVLNRKAVFHAKPDTDITSQVTSELDKIK